MLNRNADSPSSTTKPAHPSSRLPCTVPSMRVAPLRARVLRTRRPCRLERHLIARSLWCAVMARGSPSRRPEVRSQCPTRTPSHPRPRSGGAAAIGCGLTVGAAARLDESLLPDPPPSATVPAGTCLPRAGPRRQALASLPTSCSRGELPRFEESPAPGARLARVRADAVWFRSARHPPFLPTSR